MSNTPALPFDGAPGDVQASLPAVSEAPKFKTYTELELDAIRRRLIDANGNLDAAGISLAEMRDVIYTCRMKANPMQEAAEVPKQPKAPRAPKAAKELSVKTKLSGNDVADFFG